uniref:cytochrome c oxidase subunit III n=1 Tax=Neoseiulus chebalingensis TaxID=3061192 RepID=UPI0030FE287A
MYNMPHNHTFHIVDPSPWPLFNSLNLMNLIFNSLLYIKFNNQINIILMMLIFTLMILTMSLWWRDVFRESTFQGHHTFNVYKMMKISMVMFICSEIMFFVSFFWGFLSFSLCPEMEISNNWPPTSINMINPFQIPLLNTSILLSSGVTITLAHFSMLKNKYYITYWNLMMTVIMGLVFSFIQMMEYKWTDFSINDNVFGSTFFMTTGFHGLHVLIGTFFLMINIMRLQKNQFSSIHHFSFEASAWYWHFVDVVWIYLFILMYWWFY